MAQYKMPTIVPATDTGTTLSNHLNDWVDATNSSHSGPNTTTLSTYRVDGMPFYNTTDKSWGVWNGVDYKMRFSDDARFDGNIGIGIAPTTNEFTVNGAGRFYKRLEAGSGSGQALTNEIFNVNGTPTGTKPLALINGGATTTAGKSLFRVQLQTGNTDFASINMIESGVSGLSTFPSFSVKGDGAIWAAALSTTAGNAITSDTRMKKDWRDGSHDLNDFDGVETGHFKFIHHDDDLEHYGFKAQSLPAECQNLTDQIVPEHEDLYYDDVTVTTDEPVLDDEGNQTYDDDGNVITQPVTTTERQRNDTPFDDAHRVLAVNVGAVLAKTVEHNKMLKAQLTAIEARLAALEND